MKKTKKLISILLSVLMLLSITSGLNFSAYALTSGDFEYRVYDDGTAGITGYLGEGGDVVIPDTIDGYTVVDFYTDIFYCVDITSISMPATITGLDDSIVNPFCELIGLANIFVDSNNENYKSVDGVLYNKSMTKLIAYPTQKKDEVFEIPNGVIKVLDYAFYCQDYLRKLIIPQTCNDFSPLSLHNPYSLTEIEVDENNSNYSSIDGVLFLKYVSGLKLCKYPPSKAAEEYVIPYGVTTIFSDSFEWCNNLRAITIPSTITQLYYDSFVYCTNLQAITIPKSITEIASYSFNGSDNITDIYYTGSEEEWNSISIDSYNDVLYNATVHYNYVPDCSHTNIDSQVIQPTCTTGGFTISICTDCGYEYNSDETSALGHLFENYTAVDSENHKAICSRENCNVADINSHNFVDDTCEVCGCVSTDTNYDYEYNVLANKTVEITYYYGSSGNVVIPSTIIGYPVAKIGGHSFDGLSYITSIRIPSSVTEIETAAFTHCINLSSITVDENNTVYDSRKNCNAIIKTSSNTLIAGCRNTIIPNGIITIGEEAFGGALGLTNIEIPNSVKVIEQYAFLDCSDLESIVLPNISKIDSETFSCCSNLKSITIPNTVTQISDKFFYCENLSDIYYEGSEEQWNNIIGIDDIEAFQNATIHYNYVIDVPVDTTAYDDALAEANAIMGASDYLTKYLASSRTAYENAVNAEIRDDFITQEEADSAASAIISAKSLLTYSQSTVDFYIVDENGNVTNHISETVSYGDALTLNAGDYISDSDRITKWVAISGVNSNESKVATSQRSYTMVVTKPVKIYAHYVTISAEPTVKYSRITFIGKNGCVIEVKYVKEGEDLDTSTVEAPKIPFYQFIGWNKSSVTANGSDIFVKANYKFIETEEDKCKVHYVQNGNIIVKSYAYDSFVYIYGAEDKKLALSTDGTTAGIITYLDENAFYAPHCSDIYVIEVEEMNSSIGITGSYSYVTDENKIAAFNCKAYLPEGFTLVECGLIASSEKGSMKIEAESVSPRGEYCIKVLLDNNTQITAVKGKAYLVFKNSSGDLVTIESDEITQSL